MVFVVGSFGALFGVEAFDNVLRFADVYGVDLFDVYIVYVVFLVSDNVEEVC